MEDCSDRVKKLLLTLRIDLLVLVVLSCVFTELVGQVEVLLEVQILSF